MGILDSFDFILRKFEKPSKMYFSKKSKPSNKKPEDLKSWERESGVTRLFLGIEPDLQIIFLNQESIIPSFEFFKISSAETNLPPGLRILKACLQNSIRSEKKEALSRQRILSKD